MDKSVANADPATTIDPRSAPDEETARLFKLLEDAQSPLYLGCEYTVQESINQLMEIKVSDDSVTDECMDFLLAMLVRMLPDGRKLEQFNNMKKIDELLRAQMLMHELKSQGSDAESSKQVPNSTRGQEMLRESGQDGAKPESVVAAKSGDRKKKRKGKGKKALDAGTTPK